MCANAGVEADALDDMPGIKPLHLGVGVQFIEEGNAEGQIGVGEQLDRLGLSEAHEQRVNVLFDCTFLQQTGKLMSSFYQTLIVQVSSNDNAGRIQVIVEGLGFTQEFRAENVFLLLNFSLTLAV